MNQKFKISFAIMLLMLCAEQTIAQNYVPTYLLDSPDDFISTNFDVFDSSGWFEKKENATVNFLNFLPNNKQSFGMGSDDNFVLTRTTDDDLPFMELDKKMTHHRYNQTIKE